MAKVFLTGQDRARPGLVIGVGRGLSGRRRAAPRRTRRLWSVASDPTVSRTLGALAADATVVLTAIDGARAQARATVWGSAGEQAPDHGVDGNAGSNTAADHITVVKAALKQLPGHRTGTRPGRTVPKPDLVRPRRPGR